MYDDRKELYRQLENELDTHLITYVTSDRQGFETQIASDAIDLFINHLDKIGTVERLSLYIYTRGGDTAAAWNIVNLLRQYCEDLQVIIPHKAHSAGTLISIGANSIIMTKQATLGPIDPSINTPLNPQIPNNPAATMPVSVEAVKGYLEFAKEELAIKDDMALANILIKLSDCVHPLVLGNVYRSRVQIKMLAEKLLVNQISDSSKINEIINFLCSDSGSHDYTINRREARDNLGLNIITPNEDLYKIIKEIYDDISEELGLGKPFDLRSFVDSDYSVTRGLIESLEGGNNAYISQGKAVIKNVNTPAGVQQQVCDDRIFDGWK